MGSGTDSWGTPLRRPQQPADLVPLVLLPGMNCTPRLWDDVLRDEVLRAGVLRDSALPALAGREVIHGEIAGRDLEDCVARLLEMLPERFALAGLSLGGIVAMALVRTAPERVERLCLLDTNARGPTPEQLAGFDRQLERLAEGVGPRELQEELLGVLVHPGNLDRLREDVLAMGEETRAVALADHYRIQRTRVDERPVLGRIDVPVAVIAGREDALCPPSRHEEIAGLIPGARLTLVDGAGHLAPMEKPEVVGAAMGEWLG